MMPTVHPNGMDIYYEVPGEGDPLVLISYLAAGQACCAFQAAEYARHFGGFAADLRGARLTGKPDGTSITELLAGDVAAFMQAAGVDRAHVAACLPRSDGYAAGSGLILRQVPADSRLL
jgi:pimeloyl-ACP methyl ester carboxylesterase